MAGRPHILLTALGTRKQRETYTLDGLRSVEAPLTPLALMTLLEESSRPNRVIALVTCGAREIWNAFRDGIAEIGLKAERVEIPDGVTADEIGKIIDVVGSRIPEECDLTLDVTQGFRHFPFILYALAIYLSTLRDVTIRGAYYGLVEGRKPGDPPAPIIDLKSLIVLPELFYAVRVFRQSGLTDPLARILEVERRTLPAGPTSGRLKTLQGCLEQVSFSYESGLPLELGRVAYSLMARLGGDAIGLIGGGLPLQAEVSALLCDSLQAISFTEKPHASGDWKTGVELSGEELERESRLIDMFLTRNQYALALGLMREWVVSLGVLQSGTSAWLRKKTRLAIERRLGALSKLVERKLGLSEQQQWWGQFWNELGETRNKFHHHGMAQEEVKAEGNKLLHRVLEKWEGIKQGESQIPAVGGGAGRLLVSPIGNRPGVLFSALELAKPDRCLVVCSRESRPLIPEVKDQADFQGPIEYFELTNPFGGLEEIKPLGRLETLSEINVDILLDAEAVIANLTGGTTLMGIAVQMLAERAVDLQRKTRRLVLIDERSGAEQDREPYVISDYLWLDGENNDGDS